MSNSKLKSIVQNYVKNITFNLEEEGKNLHIFAYIIY